MLTIRSLWRLAVIGLLAGCMVPQPSAQPTSPRPSPQRPSAERPYDEAGVRLVLLDITLGQDYAYYRGHIEQPDVREAIRRWDAGVRVRNADHFGRVQAQRAGGMGHYTFRDRSRAAQGMDVVLTTDPERERPVRALAGYNEAQVRLILLDITLGQSYAYYRGRIEQPDVREAIRRWDGGVRVRNADHFGRVQAQRGRGVGHYTFRDRSRAAQGMDVVLTTDPEREWPVRAPAGYNEAQVRLILLDITLGQSYAYYRGHIEQPDAREAIRRWDAGIRVVNGGRFERKQLTALGVWHRVYRGTSRDVDGRDVVLTSDAESRRRVEPPPHAYNEAMVRLILLDIALAKNYAYYRGRLERPDVREAVRRWDAGVRVRNANQFERRTRGAGDVHRRWRGSNREANGMDVVLTTDPERRRP